MILKTIELINFKSHKNSQIVFDEITSFIGTSDHGKTNIIRALKLVIFNEDWPASWIRYNQTESKIILTLNNGYTITRYRTKKTQGYEIIDPFGKKEEYVGKNDVTSIIQNITGFKKAVLDENIGPENLNWIQVHDPPALLGSSSAAVQRKIAGLLNLGQLEEAKIAFKKVLRDHNKTLIDLQSKKEDLIAEAVPLAEKLDIANNLLNSIQELNRQWEKLNEDAQKLNSLIENMHVLTIRTDLAEESLLAVKESLNRIKVMLQVIKVVKKIKDPNLIAKQTALLKSTKVKITNLQKLIAGYKYNKLKIAEELLIADLKSLKELLNKFNICPTCKRALK